MSNRSKTGGKWTLDVIISKLSSRQLKRKSNTEEDDSVIAEGDDNEAIQNTGSVRRRQERKGKVRKLTRICEEELDLSRDEGTDSIIKQEEHPDQIKDVTSDDGGELGDEDDTGAKSPVFKVMQIDGKCKLLANQGNDESDVNWTPRGQLAPTLESLQSLHDEQEEYELFNTQCSEDTPKEGEKADVATHDANLRKLFECVDKISPHLFSRNTNCPLKSPMWLQQADNGKYLLPESEEGSQTLSLLEKCVSRIDNENVQGLTLQDSHYFGDYLEPDVSDSTETSEGEEFQPVNQIEHLSSCVNRLPYNKHSNSPANQEQETFTASDVHRTNETGCLELERDYTMMGKPVNVNNPLKDLADYVDKPLSPSLQTGLAFRDDLYRYNSEPSNCFSNDSDDDDDNDDFNSPRIINVMSLSESPMKSNPPERIATDARSISPEVTTAVNGTGGNYKHGLDILNNDSSNVGNSRNIIQNLESRLLDFLPKEGSSQSGIKESDFKHKGWVSHKGVRNWKDLNSAAISEIAHEITCVYGMKGCACKNMPQIHMSSDAMSRKRYQKIAPKFKQPMREFVEPCVNNVKVSPLTTPYLTQSSNSTQVNVPPSGNSLQAMANVVTDTCMNSMQCLSSPQMVDCRNQVVQNPEIDETSGESCKLWANSDIGTNCVNNDDDKNVPSDATCALSNEKIVDESASSAQSEQSEDVGDAIPTQDKSVDVVNSEDINEAIRTSNYAVLLNAPDKEEVNKALENRNFVDEPMGSILNMFELRHGSETVEMGDQPESDRMNEAVTEGLPPGRRYRKDLMYYVCKKCSKTFVRAVNLRKHAFSHILEDEKPFTCQYCGKKFVNLSALGRHAIVHSRRQYYTCHICNVGLSDAFLLEWHMKTNHGVNILPDTGPLHVNNDGPIDGTCMANTGTNHETNTVASNETNVSAGTQANTGLSVGTMVTDTIDLTAGDCDEETNGEVVSGVQIGNTLATKQSDVLSSGDSTSVSCKEEPSSPIQIKEECDSVGKISGYDWNYNITNCPRHNQTCDTKYFMHDEEKKHFQCFTYQENMHHHDHAQESIKPEEHIHDQEHMHYQEHLRYQEHAYHHQHMHCQDHMHNQEHMHDQKNMHYQEHMYYQEQLHHQENMHDQKHMHDQDLTPKGDMHHQSSTSCKNSNCKSSQTTSSQTFRCPTCFHLFLSHSSFICHLATHWQGNKLRRKERYRCGLCNLVFTLKLSLEDHFAFVHGLRISVVKEFRCWSCEEVFCSYDVLSEHIAMCHRDNAIKSGGKGSSITFDEKTRAHKSFRCRVCFQFSGSKDELRAHSKTHDGQAFRVDFACKKPSRFISPSKTISPCSSTASSSATTAQVLHHVKELRALKQLVTENNNQGEGSGSNEQRKFQCWLCMAEFSQEFDLKVHVNMAHTHQAKKIRVRVKSNSRTTKLSSLSVHVCHVPPNRPGLRRRRSEPVKPKETSTKTFECQLCGKHFSTDFDLQVHLHLHANELRKDTLHQLASNSHDGRHGNFSSTGTKLEPYTCNICINQQFSSSAELEDHMQRSHNTDQAYTCKFTLAGLHLKRSVVHTDKS